MICSFIMRKFHVKKRITIVKKKILASSLSVFKMSVQVNDTIQNNEHVDVAET